MGAKDVLLGIFAPLARLLKDVPLGAVYPGNRKRFPEQDGREIALAALRKYLAAIPFADPEKASETLRIEEKDIHAEWAADGQEPALPAAGVVSAPADLDFEYLGGQIYLDDTLDKYGQGTALVFFGYHTEDLVIEVWCRDVPQRRAVVAGLKLAFWASDGRGSIDLVLDKYYDRSARFWLHKAWVPDEPEGLRGGRRRALLTVRLQVPEVLLVDAGSMRPITRTSLG